MRALLPVCFISLCGLVCIPASAEQGMAKKPRARDLGIQFSGTPGKLNAITDIDGVLVGHRTIVKEADKPRGKGEARTGVTAILPRGRKLDDPVYAGWFSLNGNGEMTGTTWIEESGFLEGPVMITNTLSVGTVHTSTIKWAIKLSAKKYGEDFGGLPVVAETWDGDLNDIKAFHVEEADATAALDGAMGGAVPEGNVGGGTGMICYDFKGGIGTSSRLVDIPKYGRYTVGVLVQANHGERKDLMITGVPIGKELPLPQDRDGTGGKGSIIIVIATDAPLLPNQLKRLARRAALGVARTGTITHDGSGEIFLAFSTANPGAHDAPKVADLKVLPNEQMNPLFAATVEASEESIINAMIAAETMTGFKGKKIEAIDHNAVKKILKQYNRTP